MIEDNDLNQNHQGKSILVVDDEPGNLELIATILQHDSYIVLPASSALEALKLLETHKPDLIISDIMMPHMSGYELYQEVRQNPELQAVPFIFLSAKGKRADIRYGKELGVDDYLTKPFSRQDLLLTIRNKLQRAQDFIAEAENRLNTLKNDIMRSLSHEFRTPLTIIKGSIELMSRDLNLNQQQHFNEWLEHIKHNSDRLENLVEDFLLMAKAESGELLREFEKYKVPLSLPLLLPMLLAPFKQLAEQRHMRFNLDIAPSTPDLYVCERHLLIVLTKLLDNSFKFSPEHEGEVGIKVDHPDDVIRIAVYNQGDLIAPEHQEKVFDKFYQIGRQYWEQQGTGVGLTIAKQLVELNGGQIRAYNQEDRLNVFELQFPIKPLELRVR